MKKNLGYNIHSDVKDVYDKFITKKYGHKRNRCGPELEKAIKLYLTLNGDDSYCDDPDVREMLDTLGGDELAHSHSSKKKSRGDMDLFAAEFIKEYRDRKQVTRNELGHFASFLDGVCDPRAIQNRVNFLIGRGVLEPFAPNVFEVKKEGYVGFR